MIEHINAGLLSILLFQKRNNDIMNHIGQKTTQFSQPMADETITTPMYHRVERRVYVLGELVTNMHLFRSQVITRMRSIGDICRFHQVIERSLQPLFLQFALLNVYLIM